MEENRLSGDPRHAVAQRAVSVVFLCLLSDFLLLTIVIPYVPQLLSTQPPEGVGVFSATLIGMPNRNAIRPTCVTGAGPAPRRQSKFRVALD